jgi:hypothetical protein
MNHWPLAGTMNSGKNHEGPVISKIFTVLSSYKSPPPRLTIYTQLRRGCEVLFHLPDEFSSSMFQVTKTGEQSFNAHEEFCGCLPAGAFHPSFPISFFKHSALHSDAAAAVLGCSSLPHFFVPLKSLHSRRKMAKIQIPRNDNALPLRCVKIHSLSNAKVSFLHYL